MNAIESNDRIRYLRGLLLEMTEADSGQPEELRMSWLENHMWKVAPVEDVGHFSPVERNRIVTALRHAGCEECVAVATESLGGLPEAYRLAISEADFEQFDRECGLLRFILTVEERDWAISCNESYKLIAGPGMLVESMLGVSVEAAWKKFRAFTELAAIDPNGSLRRSVDRYSPLGGKHP